MTKEWRGNGDAVASGLPELSPTMVDGDDGLDGGQRWVQHDGADTDGTSPWSAVARLDGESFPKSAPAAPHRGS